MLHGRPCNSRTRAKNRWTRNELVREAKKHGVASEGRTMTAICKMKPKKATKTKAKRRVIVTQAPKYKLAPLNPILLLAREIELLPYGKVSDQLSNLMMELIMTLIKAKARVSTSKQLQDYFGDGNEFLKYFASLFNVNIDRPPAAGFDADVIAHILHAYGYKGSKQDEAEFPTNPI